MGPALDGRGPIRRQRGYEFDYSFTESWKYRDWLIRSFQSNKPLDRFIQEQIAGDELWPDSPEAADAALFLTIGPATPRRRNPARRPARIRMVHRCDRHHRLASFSARPWPARAATITSSILSPSSDYYGMQAISRTVNSTKNTSRQGRSGYRGLQAFARPAAINPPMSTSCAAANLNRRWPNRHRPFPRFSPVVR